MHKNPIHWSTFKFSEMCLEEKSRAFSYSVYKVLDLLSSFQEGDGKRISWYLNQWPQDPKAGIIPLDHGRDKYKFDQVCINTL